MISLSLFQKEITDSIANEMKGAKFFAIIADSTIDHTKVDEFSICLRYVLKKGQIAERFISFQQLEDSKSETMYHKIQGVSKYMKPIKLLINMLILTLFFVFFRFDCSYK